MERKSFSKACLSCLLILVVSGCVNEAPLEITTEDEKKAQFDVKMTRGIKYQPKETIENTTNLSVINDTIVTLVTNQTYYPTVSTGGSSKPNVPTIEPELPIPLPTASLWIDNGSVWIDVENLYTIAIWLNYDGNITNTSNGDLMGSDGCKTFLDTLTGPDVRIEEYIKYYELRECWTGITGTGILFNVETDGNLSFYLADMIGIVKVNETFNQTFLILPSY